MKIREHKMNTIKQEEYMGEVLNDGHLSLPEGVRQRLSLMPSSVVKVVITLAHPETESTNDAWNLFRSMGHSAKPGILEKSAEDHDRHLYGKPTK
jgi:hypothetical protein